MTLGISEAARQLKYRLNIRLAVDTNENSLEIYKANFGTEAVQAADVMGLFDGAPGSSLSPVERRLAKKIGAVDILMGGPPCQGHSDLNNHTRRNDPKNALYLRMARAAEVLKSKVVVIENVATVRWDTARIVERTMEAMRIAGYEVSERVMDLRRLGVPQTRKRHVVIASRTNVLKPDPIFTAIESKHTGHPYRNVYWAICDLLNNTLTSEFNLAGKIRDINARRINYLFDNDLYELPDAERPACHQNGNHSYNSVYGRLSWDKPAQTITTGFGCMGQGRFVHPQLRRTITPHEAARLQTFPDWFDFGRRTSRTTFSEVIGNAVPPLLMREIGVQLLEQLSTEESI